MAVLGIHKLIEGGNSVYLIGWLTLLLTSYQFLTTEVGAHLVHLVMVLR